MLEPVDERYEYYAETVTESDFHGAAARYLIESLRLHFLGQPVYVAGDLFVYPVQGDPKTKVSPDVFVCFGAEQRDRKIYRTWIDGPPPAVVFELTSESSRLSDLGEKRQRYEAMGVEEYYLFDPLGEYLAGQLRAFERQGDVLIPRVGSPLVSPRLGLELVVDGTLLRLRKPDGEAYSTYLEEHRARLEEQQARLEEHQALLQERQARLEAEKAREEAEARMRALEAELQRLRES